MFITFSPLLFNEKISKIRLFIFNTFSKTFVFISFISFIFYVLGITPVIVVNAVRGFQGITNHPNTFAPIAAISFFYILVKFNNIGRIYYFLVLVIMMFLVLISGSRATILGVLIGVLFYAYIKKYLNLKGGIMLLIILGVGYYLTLNSFLNFDILLTKQELSSEKGSATSSRDVLWNSRFKEFMSSPILGIGPNAVDLYHYNHEMSNNSSIDNGTVETGSAWLAQLSMIGILGFVSFLFIYLKAIRNSFKNHLKFNDFLLSFLLLFFFSAHLMFEGNIFAAGSPIMLFFWSTISIGFIKIKKHKL
jgi:teichuronic acid biosynthesis protein TuaE